MCGCTASNDFDARHPHDDHCECVCHHGIVNRPSRCWDSYPVTTCYRRKGHDGAHSNKDTSALLTWVDEDQAVAETPRMRQREKPTTSHGHPDYYGGKDNPYEAIKVIHAWDLNFDLGNVVKYISRAGKKNGESALVDLRKARSYLDFAIEQITQGED